MTGKRVIEILRLFERGECAVAKTARRRNAGDEDVAAYHGERIAALRIAIDAVRRMWEGGLK